MKDNDKECNILHSATTASPVAKPEDGFMACRENEPAYCSAACPFSLDVVGFMAKAARGNFNAAYRLYRDAVAYPGIVSALCSQPCREHCLRQRIDAALEIRQVEQTVTRLATRKNPPDFNVPAKEQRVAIIGAGPAGLACMYRLSTRRYQVNIFESTSRLGGRLWQDLPEQLFLSELAQQHAHIDFTLDPSREITDLSQLADFQAIFIATGDAGRDFAQATGLSAPAHVLCGQRSGVFLGGSLLGANSVEAIAAGLQAANCIEYYLKTGIMKNPTPSGTRLTPDARVLQKIPAAYPSQTDLTEKEQAVAEAGRCLSCGCSSCQKNCAMLSFYHKPIKRVYNEALLAAHPTSVDGTAAQGRRTVASCSQCGLCAKVCPEHLSLGEVILRSRQDIQTAGNMPWAFYEYWLRDLEFSNSEQAYLWKDPPGYENKSRYLFFPGCQLCASAPGLTEKTYEKLRELDESTGIALGCCGIAAQSSGNTQLFLAVKQQLLSSWEECGRPQMIFACPSCMKLFGREMPEITGISLIEYLYDQGLRIKKPAQLHTVSVVDPCAAREDKNLHIKARKLLLQAGLCLEELDDHGEYARCCGFGGHISLINPELAAEISNKRKDALRRPAIGYCINCVEQLKDDEHPAYHLLELLWDVAAEAAASPTVKRRHRSQLKKDLLQKIWGEEWSVPEQSSGSDLFVYDEGVRESVAQELLLEDDIEKAVLYGEKSCNKIADPVSNCFFTCAQIGHYTCWVKYSAEKTPCGNCFHIHDAYCHRMKIE